MAREYGVERFREMVDGVVALAGRWRGRFQENERAETQLRELLSKVLGFEAGDLSSDVRLAASAFSEVIALGVGDRYTYDEATMHLKNFLIGAAVMERMLGKEK